MVRVSLVLRLQPRDEQELHVGRGIFGSRKPAGTPEPGSYWSLRGRTGGPRRAIRLLPVLVTAEWPTLMSLLRVQGATDQLWSVRGQGSPHTQALIAGPKSPWLRAADPMLTPTAAPGDQLFCAERNQH